MTIIYGSLVLLIASALISIFRLGSIYRYGYVALAMIWSLFLLFFYMDALSRIVASSGVAVGPFSSDFANGMYAYKRALDEFRFAVIIVILSALILVIIPRSTVKSGKIN